MRVLKWLVLGPIIALGSLMALVIVLGLSGALDGGAPGQEALSPPAAVPAARSTPAPAASAGFLDQAKPIFIVSQSAQRPVLKSREAMDRAQKLIADGISAQRPDLVRELVACTVPVGTRVSLLGMAGFNHRRVMVAEGPDVGCEGVVAFDWLSNTRPAASTGSQGTADRR